MSLTALTRTQDFSTHSHALVESNDIGPGTRIWAFAHVMHGTRIGAQCNICDHVFIESGAVLGNNVTVKNGVVIWDRVIIEDNVFLGPNCVLTNDANPRTYLKKSGDALTPTLVRANATIGANATIVCGVTIGRFAFIGAGAVVIRSIPDFALVVGNPARHIGWMCVCAQRLPLRPAVSQNSAMACPKCSRVFTLLDGELFIVP